MTQKYDTRFDQMFLSTIQQLGSVEKFFDTLFGFCAFKTDLFTQPDNTKTMVNMFLNKRLDEFKKDKQAHEEIKRQTALKKAEEEAKRAEAEKTRKYYEAEKLKIENEKRAKQGLPPLYDPEAEAEKKKAAKEADKGATVEEVSEEEAAKI